MLDKNRKITSNNIGTTQTNIVFKDMAEIEGWLKDLFRGDKSWGQGAWSNAPTKILNQIAAYKIGKLRGDFDLEFQARETLKQLLKEVSITNPKID